LGFLVRKYLCHLATLAKTVVLSGSEKVSNFFSQQIESRTERNVCLRNDSTENGNLETNQGDQIGRFFSQKHLVNLMNHHLRQL
jgi:hypothetical protein